MITITLLLLSVAGAVIATIVGTLWYSPGTPMGKIHMQYLGFDLLSAEEQKQKILTAKPKMPTLYLAQMILSFLTAFFVVFVVTMSTQNGVPTLLAVGFPVMGWLCFTVPTIGSAILWGNDNRHIVLKRFFSDSAANLVTIVLIALMTTLFV